MVSEHVNGRWHLLLDVFRICSRGMHHDRQLPVRARQTFGAHGRGISQPKSGLILHADSCQRRGASQSIRGGSQQIHASRGLNHRADVRPYPLLEQYHELSS